MKRAFAGRLAVLASKRLLSTVKPKDEDDARDLENQKKGLTSMGPMCLAKAGDCAGARSVYKAENPTLSDDIVAASLPAMTNHKCK